MWIPLELSLWHLACWPAVVLRRYREWKALELLRDWMTLPDPKFPLEVVVTYWVDIPLAAFRRYKKRR
jgi:hypothetical protein